ncbi:hypothetical protein HA402_009863 [Bradysia odoriphaga]|nr:hypothetical protein HA402_009863 [Bradysia odoriphaga]
MGFIHGESYIITSAFDGCVFDVKKKRKNNGAKVLSWNWSGEPHQIWTASSESGGFRLQASHVTDNLKVLDQEHGSSRLIIFDFQGGDNQLWNAFPVAHNPGAFFIQNVRSGLTIRNNGRGNNLECTPFNEHDPNSHWRLTPLSSL